MRYEVVDRDRRGRLLVAKVSNGVDIGGIEGAATNLPRKGSKFHVRSNPGIAQLMRRAHLVRPERPLRFSWERVL